MTTTSNGLATLPRGGEAPARMNLAEAVGLGEVMFKSGLFPDVRSAAACVVKIIAGAELGFGPMASMSDVHFIEGKPSLGAHLRAASIKRSDKYDYDVIERSDTACELEFFERKADTGGPVRKHVGGWVPIGRLRYTIEEATRKGWTVTSNNKSKLPWVKTPANMLFARVLTDGYKTYCPDLSAGLLTYDPDELDSRAPLPNGLHEAPALPAEARPLALPAEPEPPVQAPAPPAAEAQPAVLPSGGAVRHEQLDRIDMLYQALDLSREAFDQRVFQLYGASSVAALSSAEADDLVAKLEAAKAAKEGQAHAAAKS